MEGICAPASPANPAHRRDIEPCIADVNTAGVAMREAVRIMLVQEQEVGRFWRPFHTPLAEAELRTHGQSRWSQCRAADGVDRASGA